MSKIVTTILHNDCGTKNAAECGAESRNYNTTVPLSRIAIALQQIIRVCESEWHGLGILRQTTRENVVNEYNLLLITMLTLFLATLICVSNVCSSVTSVSPICVNKVCNNFICFRFLVQISLLLSKLLLLRLIRRSVHDL